jgi:hypothetical protein
MTGYSLAMLLQAFDWELPTGARLDREVGGGSSGSMGCSLATAASRRGGG